jgi:hypothetical protein
MYVVINTIMGNPLRDMEKIYEAYTGQSVEFSKSAIGQRSPIQDRHSYSRPVPTTAPDNPSYVESPMALQPVESEEEEKKGNVSRSKLSEYVNAEIHKASMFGMDYCVMVLSELQKKFRL